MVSEAQKRAQARYDAESTRQVHLKLNTKTDADILRKLDSVATEEGGKQGYIKRLVREDIKKEEGGK